MGSFFSSERIFFIISLMVFSLLYGVGIGKWEWFPYSYLNQAVDQARVFQKQIAGEPPVPTGGPVYRRTGVNPVAPAKMQPGLTVISSSWNGPEGWEPELRLIDKKGALLHKWRLNREEVFQGGTFQRRPPSRAGIHGSYLLPDGDVVVNMEYSGTVRLDPCGNVVWKLTEGGHHSISRAEDGTFWISALSQERRSGSDQYPDGYPGLGGKKIWVDRVLHVSEGGKIMKDISVPDILYKNGLDRYIPKVLGGLYPSPEDLPNDITHLNDVESLKPSMEDEYSLFDAGDLVVSLRSLSLVFVFDPETLEVKWHSSDPFIYQHDPDFIGDGWIGVFDNNFDFEGGEMLGGSRIVGIQPHTDSTSILFDGKKLDRFYTSVQGKWQKLENGNMLLSESSTGRVVEVDPQGNPVWEWIREPVDNSTVPKVTKSTRVDLNREEVASWPCSLVDSTGATARSPSTQNQQTAR